MLTTTESSTAAQDGCKTQLQLQTYTYNCTTYIADCIIAHGSGGTLIRTAAAYIARSKLSKAMPPKTIY